MCTAGYGDYATWAQLLISTGDPDRKVNASDTAYTITASRGARMYSDGYRYVGRYINETSTGGGSKILEEGELEAIFGANLRVFPIFQDNARDYANFNWSNGYDHGQLAHDQGVHFGFDRSTVIYFACDYDATDDQMSKIIDYYQGVQSGLSSRGKRYVMGVYGSRNVCAQVTSATDARYSFVSGMSTGFSGNLGFPLPQNWAFNQVKEYTVSNGSDSFALDADAHRPGSDEGQKAVNTPADPATGFVAAIDQLYELAQQYGQGNPSRLVMEYVRHVGYGSFQWTSLIGDVDHDFVRYAEDHGASIPADFTDPFTGYLLDIEHLMASVNGHYVKPVGDISLPNAGDVSGWAGDLYTFYGEWRRDSDRYSSGYTYCQDRLAKIGVASSFGFSDMLVDADAYLIAERVLAGVPLTTAVREHYLEDGGKSRFTHYLSSRFGGSRNSATDIARTALVMDYDPTIDGGRLWLIKSTSGTAFFMPPATLPADKLTEFCQGFADVLVSRAALESA
ncbi:glycoside hydrolase domain-containing protein [Streptomyces griseoluteus]